MHTQRVLVGSLSEVCACCVYVSIYMCTLFMFVYNGFAVEVKIVVYVTSLPMCTVCHKDKDMWDMLG